MKLFQMWQTFGIFEKSTKVLDLILLIGFNCISTVIKLVNCKLICINSILYTCIICNIIYYTVNIERCIDPEIVLKTA